MALVTTEITGSGGASTTLENTGIQKHSANRSFMVYDDEGELDADVVSVMLTDGLPQIGDLHDDFEFLRVTKRSVTRMAERNDAWKIEFTYEHLIDIPEVQVSQSSEITGQFIGVWRSNAGEPDNLNSPAAADIGGTMIDSAGSPTSVMLKQQTFSLSFEQFGSIPVSTLFNATGKRNSQGFFGFAAGYLVYLGVSFATKTTSSYTRTDKFLYDGFAHCRQVVGAFDGDLNPTLDSDGHATTVFWVQPFPNTTDFSSLGIPF